MAPIRMRAGIRLGLIVIFAVTIAVRGHATLTRTEPPSNGRVEQTPGRVKLTFNEGIEPIFNSLRVFNRNGLRIDTGEVSLTRNAKEMSTTLKPSLPRGIYTVDWRATSSDGHQIGGHFGFSIGEEFSATAATGSRPEIMQALPTPGMVVTRWIYFVAAALFVGAFGFGALVLVPSLRALALPADNSVRALTNFTKTALLSWGVLLLASIVNLWLKAAAMADSTLLQAAGLDILKSVALLTRWGQMWLVGSVVLLVAGVAFWLYSRSERSSRTPGGNPVWLWIGLVLGAGFTTTVSNSGHAAGVSEWTTLAIAADTLHLLATSLWVGGLYYVVRIMRALHDKGSDAYARFMGELIPRFSRIAQICVSTIVATGIYTAWLHMPSWSSFVTTLYGRTLLVKLLLVVPLIVIGAINLLVIKPRLRESLLQSGRKAWESAAQILGRFQPLVRTEVIIGVAILLVVTILTNVPPASTSASAGPAISANETDFNVSLRVEPNRIGRNVARVAVRDKQGKPVTDLASVLLVVSMVDMDMGTERIDAKPQPDGTYASEVVLGMSGKWEIDVRLMKKGSSDQRSATFHTEVPSQ